MKGLRAQPKQKNVHLSLREKMMLRRAIFERDHKCCVICGKKAEHWHHQPFGADKSDELSKGVALCAMCHHILHNDPNRGQMYEKIVKDYLRSLYGGGKHDKEKCRRR